MRRHVCAALLLLTTLAVRPSAGLKVLVVHPGVSKSHVKFGHRLAAAAAALNHTAFVWSPFYEGIGDYGAPPRGVGEHRVPYPVDVYDELFGNAFHEHSLLAEMPLWDRFDEQALYDACRIQYERNGEAIERIRRQKFDLTIGHSMCHCPLILSHAMGIKNFVWEMAGAYVLDNAALLHGVPRPASFVPFVMSSSSDRMSFAERLSNALWTGAGELLYHSAGYVVRRQCDMYTEAPNYDYPDCWSDLGGRAKGMVINGDALLDFPRPLLHTVAFLGSEAEGGANAKSTPPPLDADWLRVVDDPTKKGVILFSLGSVADTRLMPHAIKMSLLSAFGRFADYTVVWKYDGPPFAEAAAHPHVHLVEWQPQAAILGHRNTKAFITHAGFNSLLEGATAGVPMLLVPLFIDQFNNARRAVRLGIGLAADKRSLDEEDVVGKLGALLREPRYAARSRQVSELLADRMAPADAILEYNLRRFTKPHLDTVHDMRPVRKMGYVAHFCLDVILVWSSLVAIGCYSLARLALYGVRFLK